MAGVDEVRCDGFGFQIDCDLVGGGAICSSNDLGSTWEERWVRGSEPLEDLALMGFVQIDLVEGEVGGTEIGFGDDSFELDDFVERERVERVSGRSGKSEVKAVEK